jgi:phosphopantetheinyl transferase
MALWYCRAHSGEESSLSVRRLLFHALRAEYGIERAKIEKDGRGKPFFPDLPEIFFSLSHSGEHLLCALADVPIGCDIQLRRELREGLAEKLMDEREAREFEFFELWCLRESLLKMRGEGSLRHDRFRREAGKIVPPGGSAVCRVYGDVPQCAAAACAESGALPEKIIIVPEKDIFVLK